MIKRFRKEGGILLSATMISILGGETMKKLILACLVGVFVMASAVAYGAERAPLGDGNLAIKVDYLEFTDDDLDDTDLDSGAYVALEGFFEVIQNLYLGGEVGYVKTEDTVNDIFGVDVDLDLTYVPVELNLKYAIELAPQFVFDLGGGISYNYAKVEASAWGVSEDDDEWLFGGQFFVDLDYTLNSVFFGINAKYQMTEEWDGTPFDNWRIGGQVGIMF
jgi:opacity protein-like surface antigen